MRKIIDVTTILVILLLILALVLFLTGHTDTRLDMISIILMLSGVLVYRLSALRFNKLYPDADFKNVPIKKIRIFKFIVISGFIIFFIGGLFMVWRIITCAIH